MTATTLPHVIFMSSDKRHQTVEKLDAMQNLLYLIGIEAADPVQVCAYANQADKILMQMQLQLLTDSGLVNRA